MTTSAPYVQGRTGQYQVSYRLDADLIEEFDQYAHQRREHKQDIVTRLLRAEMRGVNEALRGVAIEAATVRELLGETAWEALVAQAIKTVPADVRHAIAARVDRASS